MTKCILAVDSSGKAAGVCVLAEGTVLYEKTLPQGLTHSQTLLPLVQQALAATGLSPARVGLWAVTAGPGSFTGLRIGMALVKGLAFPYNTPVVAASTLEALALGSGLAGTVIPALDARRGEIYTAAFACAGNVTRLCPDTAGKPELLAEIVHASKEPVFFVGDGAEMCYTVFDCKPIVQRPSAGHGLPIARGAAFLAQQMWEKGMAATAADARPQYLRLSQAQRERAARQARYY